jgi:hypothetical protein
MRRTVILFLILILSTFYPACGQANSDKQTVIMLNPDITYQTIIGWEAVAEAGQISSSAFNNYKDLLFDLAVHDLGINVLKLPVRSGMENPVDYFTQFINGQIGFKEWRSHWDEVLNDNSDPFEINADGFQFSWLDFTVDNVVLPIKTRLEARREKLSIFAVYAGPGVTQHANHPEEYGEFVLAAYQHLQNKYGWVPDAWIVHNEPRAKKGWGVKNLGRALIAAGNRLKAHGYNPAFVAPETASMAAAVKRFDQLNRMPGISRYLKVLSYHRYGGVSEANLKAIGERATTHGIKTAMLEHIGSGYEDLHNDLKIGRNSAWEQFALAFPTKDNGAQYYWIDSDDPQNPVVNIGRRTKFLRQYFRFIRSGAVRIQASSNDRNFDPLAFINTDGKYVVIVKAETGGFFFIQGLPAGSYGIKYTTHSQYDVDAAGTTISAGQVLNTSIPEKGVITIYSEPT